MAWFTAKSANNTIQTPIAQLKNGHTPESYEHGNEYQELKSNIHSKLIDMKAKLLLPILLCASLIGSCNRSAKNYSPQTTDQAASHAGGWSSHGFSTGTRAF